MFKNLHKPLIFFLALSMAVSFLFTAVIFAKNGDINDTQIIVDCIGREVKIPKKVEKIGCLFAFSGHAVGMLGRGNDIVAIVEGLKRDVLFTDMYSNIHNALVPSINSNLNIEELARTNCDLLFIKGENAFNERYVAQIEKFNIPYLVVDFHSIEDQQYAIQMIGQAISKETKAQDFIDYYRNCIQRVQEKLSKIELTNRIRVFHSVNEATRTDARNTIPAEWIEIAGAINVSLDTDLKFLDNKYFASLEQILLWDPEVILVNQEHVDEYILTNEQWANLQAVKNKRVYKMPNGVSRWGHPNSLETPLAILWTAKLLYPHLFEGIDMQKEVAYFYRTFYDWELSDDYIKKILSGKGMRSRKGDT